MWEYQRRVAKIIILKKLVTSHKNTSLFIPYISTKIKACPSMRSNVTTNRRLKADLIVFFWNKTFLWRAVRLFLGFVEVQLIRQGMNLKHKIFWSIIRGKKHLDHQDNKLLKYRRKVWILFPSWGPLRNGEVMISSEQLKCFPAS